MLMTQISMDEKFKRAAEVICKQGMVQFPVSDTAIAIVVAVVGNNEEELDLIYAFREKPSQTAEQLVESSGLTAAKVEQLATSLAAKGLVFNQPSSAGIMIYRLLPLMLVGVMEYKFMVPLSSS
jgi:tRNA A37 threonylcarbamoyladenosine synthetase subunit TsaC/SUA5/YrdC